MNYELRELQIEDGEELLQMVQEMGEGGNGFVNSLYADNMDPFKHKLVKNFETSRGINLLPGMVPQTIYWLYVGGIPVGYGKFRHYLTDALREHGGHIGYCIRPTARKKGYATILLQEILKQAKRKGLTEVLLTCDEDNIGSRKVIENNRGVLEKIQNGSCYYWIYLYN